ncbi:MAG TPA: bifunctional phosphoglucose/phosphomannose isomerase [Syntrophomonadaceae bacterium]|nr:bifunctional phosphoglucose/phosphomannose isomerase [Syntrophomonadaceae bacterium]
MLGQDMRKYLWSLPEQFEQQMEVLMDLPGKYQRDYRNVVVTGLGGSAIGGDILRTFALSHARMPILVNRDYDLPAFVDQDTLVLAVSYSGNTEETLSSYEQACSKGADILVVSSGGRLSQQAAHDGWTVLSVPGGLVPRAANGYLFAPMVLALQSLGMVEGARTGLDETKQLLLAMRQQLGSDEEQNPARQMAEQIKDHIPIIWGSSSHSEAAAMRWKGQINENAKAPAYFGILPELNHNEIVGFEVPADLLSRLVVVILRDRYDHPRVQKRIEISRGMIEDRVAAVLEVPSQGESFLARVYSLIYMGDWVSYYLALAYDIDPTPVAAIDRLKNELAKG